MRRIGLGTTALCTLTIVLLVSSPARAAGDTYLRGVSLGVGVGLAAPSGQLAAGDPTKLKPNFGWGFYVNIPIISSLHLMPHAELYKVADKVTATDIGLALKFIVDTPILKPYVGASIGDTNLVSAQQLNVGFLGGLAYNLVANLDAFAEARYVVVVRDTSEGGNLKTIHALVGLLLRF